jgi:aspartate ammonia-lyase
MRIEQDSIGKLELPGDAVYGIHSLRSINNFPASGERIHPILIKAYLLVKKASAETNYKIGKLSEEIFGNIDNAINKLLEETERAINEKSSSIFEQVVVDPYQGGAGTSLNMNINEIITNTALKLAGKEYGNYDYIHPIDDVNMSQSTNDTFPTAFKIAAIYSLRELADSFAVLQRSLQKKEEEFKNILKLGRTQLQDAVPVTLGQEFGAYAQAFARDRWRLYNAEERLRSVNLGGTAVGTSVTADKKFVLNVNGILKKITGLPIAKSEDLIDATQNLDMIAEVHGLVKSGATTIIKMCNDLRILSSGPKGGIGEIKLPSVQAGSSIMPGKVNPVIPEHSIQAAELVKSNDTAVTNLVSSGNLELNAFLPMISHLFLKSVGMLNLSNRNLAEKCIEGIKADEERCRENLMKGSAIAASLIPEFGYEKIQSIVKKAYEKDIPFVQALQESEFIEENELQNILSKEMGLKIE